MTGISLSVTIEVDRDRLGEIAERLGGDRTGFNRAIGEHLLNRLHDRFAAQRAPDGSPWQPLSPVTIAAREKARPGAPLTILRMWGDFYSSFNLRADAEAARIGTGAVQGAIQHFGGPAGRGLKVTIPARPILGLEPDDPEEMIWMARDWLDL